MLAPGDRERAVAFAPSERRQVGLERMDLLIEEPASRPEGDEGFRSAVLLFEVDTASDPHSHDHGQYPPIREL